MKAYVHKKKALVDGQAFTKYGSLIYESVISCDLL